MTLLLDPASGVRAGLDQAAPELRVGPYRDATGTWAIVKHADGRRAVVSVSRDARVLPIGRLRPW